MSKNTSFIKRDRSQKIKALAHRFAIDFAAKNDDPLYKRYHALRAKYLSLKQKLFTKYRNDAINQARHSFRNVTDATGKSRRKKK